MTTVITALRQQSRPLFEGEENRAFRAQRYAIKARDDFRCTHVTEDDEGASRCKEEMGLTVVSVADEKPFLPGQERDVEQLMTRCDRHRKKARGA